MFGFFAPNVPQVTADDVKKALDKNQSVLIIDVRTPAEFAGNRIKGAINVPLDTIEDNIISVIPDKKSKIYVYCLSASRSINAVTVMMKLGYTDVYNLTSGLLAWRIKKFPLEN